MRKSVVGMLFIIAFSFFSCHKALYPTSQVGQKEISITSELKENEELAQMIAPYKKELTATMSKVLAYNPYFLNKGMNEPLSNLISDVLLQEGNKILEPLAHQKVDMALMNHGGIRRTFTQGDITVGNIFELMPFENKLVIVKLSADDVLKMAEFLQQEKTHAISGMTISLSKKGKDIIEIQGQPLDMNKDYNVITIDYLQGGGDHMDFLTHPIQKWDTDDLLRNTFLRYFETIDTIQVQTNKRYIP